MSLSDYEFKRRHHALARVHACIMNTVEPLYIDHPWGTKLWLLYRGGLYIEVSFCQYTNCSFGTWVPGRYTEGWPLRGVPLYYYCVHARR